MKHPTTALVTGGSRGIGYAIAARLANNPNVDNIVILSRTHNSAIQAAKSLTQKNMSELVKKSFISNQARNGKVLKAIGIQCDVGNPEDVFQA